MSDKIDTRTHYLMPAILGAKKRAAGVPSGDFKQMWNGKKEGEGINNNFALRENERETVDGKLKKEGNIDDASIFASSKLIDIIV